MFQQPGFFPGQPQQQQPYGAQPFPGQQAPYGAAQPYPGQPGFGAQPYPGQPGNGAQPFPGQPGNGAQPFPGQPGNGAQPYPGQPGYGMQVQQFPGQQPFGTSGAPPVGTNYTYGQPQAPAGQGFYQQQQQQPASGPLPVLDARYCAPWNGPLDLVAIEQGGVGGDNFRITDMNGQMWFQMASQLASIKGTRQLLDASNQVVCTLEASAPGPLAMFMQNTWSLYRGPQPAEHFRVCFIGRETNAPTPTVSVRMNDGDQNPDYYVTGDFGGHSFVVREQRTGRVLAECRKQMWSASPTSFLMSLGGMGGMSGMGAGANANADKYFLRVYPGADAGFVSVLAVMVDEFFHDQKPGGIAGGMGPQNAMGMTGMQAGLLKAVLGGGMPF